jgi:hypothetical protein
MKWAALVVGVLGAGVVVAAAFRAFWPMAPGPDYRELTAPARGRLERRVRRDPNEPDRAEPVADLRLLRTAAEIMLIQRNLLGLWLGCFLIQLACTLWDVTVVHVVLTVLFAVPVVGFSLYFERRAQAGLAFLERHGLRAAAAEPVE